MNNSIQAEENDFTVSRQTQGQRPLGATEISTVIQANVQAGPNAKSEETQENLQKIYGNVTEAVPKA